MDSRFATAKGGRKGILTLQYNCPGYGMTKLTSKPSADIRAADQNMLNALPDHAGRPRRRPVAFFAKPPAEIGNLLSAESTFGSVKRTWIWPYIGRVMLGVILGALIVLGMNWLARYGEPAGSDDAMIRHCGWGIAAALVAIQLWYGKFSASCSFVGTHGLAKYTMKAGQRLTPKAEVLAFEQAASLDAREGIRPEAIGRNFNFSWNDHSGKCVFRLAGETRLFVLHDGDSRPFADAAARAWKTFDIDRRQ